MREILIVRNFTTRDGHRARREMRFVEGRTGAEILTGFYRKGEKLPFRVSKKVV